MSGRRKEAKAPEVPEPENDPLDDDAVSPADLDDSETVDPDGRMPPDHQLRRRDQGRPPEQEAVERARENDPPLNPDPARDAPIAEK